MRAEFEENLAGQHAFEEESRRVHAFVLDLGSGAAPPHSTIPRMVHGYYRSRQRQATPRNTGRMSVIHTVQQLGGLASRRQLATLGHGRHVIDRALASSALVRVRRGW